MKHAQHQAALDSQIIKELAADELPVRQYGPYRLAWRHFRKHRPGLVGLFLLGLLYILAIFADIVAPYAPDSQVRQLQWAPPTTLHFRDEQGFSWRPFIYPVTSYVDENFMIRQREDISQRCYLRLFHPSEAHTVLGLISIRFRLIGFDEPAATEIQGMPYYSRYYLFGADLSGRDIFSRICYGGRISLTIGLIGTTLVMIIGLLMGGISGYAGGLVDDLLQRFGEIVMLLPGFYLLLMLRFMFPSDMSSGEVYFAVVGILAMVSWPGLARVIRNMVLSIRERDFVQAARAMGVRFVPIVTRHILPNTAGYVIVSATLSIPAYILGESALSLLGLGIMEPTPSWGNMLQKAMDISELDQHPWVLWPGAFIFVAVIAFNLVGDGLRDALDPKREKT
jgi:peptide/nickel transport system permease protein